MGTAVLVAMGIIMLGFMAYLIHGMGMLKASLIMLNLASKDSICEMNFACRASDAINEQLALNFGGK